MSFSPPEYYIEKKVHQNDRYTVYEAVNIKTQKKCFLKTFTEEVPKKSEIERLRETHRIMSCFKGPQFISVGSINEYENRIYFEMKSPAATPIVQEFEKLQLDQRLQMFMKLAPKIVRILGQVHQKVFILLSINANHFHVLEDLSNVIIYNFDSAIPFGTIPINVWQNNISYLSPEQTGKTALSIDFRSDIYSLGIVFYELLAGHVPFVYDEPHQIIQAHLNEVPTSISEYNSLVPHQLVQIINRMMEKNPSNRYQSCYSLAADLNTCISQLSKDERITTFQMGVNDRSAVFDKTSLEEVFSPKQKEVLNDEYCSLLKKIFPFSTEVEKVASILKEKCGSSSRDWKEFLYKAYLKNYVFFNNESGNWEFDLEAISGEFVSDSMVDILYNKAYQYKDNVLLLTAALFDIFFEPEQVLSVLEKYQESEISSESFHDAIKTGLLIKPYKAKKKHSHLSFAHEKIRKLVNGWLKPNQASELNRLIGKSYIDRYNQSKEIHDLITATKHFNQVIPDDLSEKCSIDLIDSNFQVSLYLQDISQFKQAISFAKKAKLLADKWLLEENKDKWFDLNYNFLSIQLASSIVDNFKAHSEYILSKELSSFQRLKILLSRAMFFASQGNIASSNQEYLKAFHLLGIETPDQIESATKDEIYSSLISYLDGDFPKNYSENEEFLVRSLVFPNGAISYWMQGKLEEGRALAYLSLILQMKQIEICPDFLRHIATVSMHHSLYKGDVSYFLNPGKFIYSFLDGRTFAGIYELCYVVTTMIAPYFASWEELSNRNEFYYRKALLNGEIGAAGNLAAVSWIWDKETNLELCNKKSERKIELIRELKLKDAYNSSIRYHNFREALMGRTNSPTSLTNHLLEEESHFNDLVKRNSQLAIGQFKMLKGILYYFFGQYELAFKTLSECINSIRHTSHFNNIEASLYYYLSACECGINDDSVERSIAFITNITQANPQKFQFLENICKSQIYADGGSYKEAFNLLDEAIDLCFDLGLLRYQALIAELGCNLAIKTGMKRRAQKYAIEAVRLYQEWGATAKASYCYDKYSDIMPRLEFVKLYQSTNSISNLDINVLNQAAQNISKEVKINKLLCELLKTVQNLSGATKVVFVRWDYDTNKYIAQGYIELDDEVNILNKDALLLLPASVINKISVSNQTLIINEAEKNPLTKSDSLVREKGIHSILLTPIVSRGRENAFLYLEHNKIPFFFTDEKVKYIEIILGQAAISLENAKVYREMKNIIKERTLSLTEKTNDIKSILKNINQGIFMIVAGNLIHPEYSHQLESILESKNFANKNVIDILFSQSNLNRENIYQIQEALTLVINELYLNFEANNHILPSEFIFKSKKNGNRIIEINWQAIISDDLVDKVLVILRDVTELRTLQVETDDRRKEIEAYANLMNHGANKIIDFLNTTLSHLNESMSRVSVQCTNEDISIIFRNIHTIKGNARVFGFTYISILCHKLEEKLSLWRKKSVDVDDETIIDDIIQITKDVQYYEKIVRENARKLDSNNSQNFGKIIKIQNLIEESTDSKDTLRHILNLCSDITSNTMEKILDDATHDLSELANKLHKAAPQVTINDPSQARFSYRQSIIIKDIFVHIFRNSLYHGIEKPEIRSHKNKPPYGNIDIDIRPHSEYISIEISDDGVGLNLVALNNKLNKKFISDEDLAEKIFESGISTTSHVSEISGRGVGMYAIRSFLINIGGNAKIIFKGPRDSKGFRKFSLKITLPINNTKNQIGLVV